MILSGRNIAVFGRHVVSSRCGRICSSNALRFSPIRLGLRKRWLSQSATRQIELQTDATTAAKFKKVLGFPKATCSVSDVLRHGADWKDKHVCIHGYLGGHRMANRKLIFAQLSGIALTPTLQLVSMLDDATVAEDSPFNMLQDLSEHTPVAVEGTIQHKRASKSKLDRGVSSSDAQKATAEPEVEVSVNRIVPLNAFPRDVIMKPDTVIGPEQRHLQIRNDRNLRDALMFRGRVARFLRQHLAQEHGFEEIETPLLFKSTPEGAREFLVPTRQPGLSYALPQSPQQYKQILMASGVPRYMQIARCFRDEDLRADRQPEFTQLDLEMAFATGEDVMQVIESTIKALWRQELESTDLPKVFPRMTYEDAMSKYGSDKPDTRLGSEIQRVDHLLPVDLISKLGPLSSPIVEVMKMKISKEPQKTRAFVNTFMDSADAVPFTGNPEGQPGIFIIDSKRPLQGLQPFGFEAAEHLEESLGLEDGDLVILQARKDDAFSGGSTPIGNLRLSLHRAAVKHGLIDAPKGFSFLWMTDFPLFSPIVDTEPGQGGAAGIASTHHPFTAPKSAEDVDLLFTDPLRAKADHYDLVVNGTELGGGSRRIHVAEMQEMVLRNILAMDDPRVKDFVHLLDVLRSGCPPHAGIALGLDRLIAIMLGKSSVRDVIAFPKSGRGEDLLVKSPSRMTDAQLETYHLRPKISGEDGESR